MSILGSRLDAPRARAARGIAYCLTALTSAAALPAQGEAAAQLQYETGVVTVSGGIATIDLLPGWRYLQPEGARHMIEKVWGNRSNTSTLGLLLPPTPWGGLIVSHEARGYVMDDGADEIDPRAMLKALQLSVEATNPARERAGRRAVQVLGWAQPPAYDPEARKLSWGRVLQVAGVAEPTLNYDVRILSAEGMLVLQAVADYVALARVVADAQAILARITLAPGFRYTDHDPLRHRRAGHGVAALISVNAPPAVGFLRLLVKPALVAAVIAGGLWFRRRLRARAPI